MTPDEEAIRELVALWHRATAADNVETVLGLMSEDVVFLVPGRPPMEGRNTFEQGLRLVLERHRIDSSGDIRELEVSGDLAWCRTLLTVRVTPRDGGEANVRSGYALSIFRRQADASWLLVRDANLLAAPA